MKRSHGTVAERIQKFQNAQRIEKSVAVGSRSSQIEIPSEGPRSQVGRGRRQEGSFGPPAERTSRDGADGARRDGRPPVGPIDGQLSPSMLPSQSLSPPAATISARTLPSHDDPYLSLREQMRAPQIRRSHENMTESKTEIATARSRLKSVSEKKGQGQYIAPAGAHTIAELNNMIDDAIEEHAADIPAEASGEVSKQTSPQHTMVRRWESERSPRRSIEDVDFHPPDLPDKQLGQSRPQSSCGVPNILARSPRQNWLPARKSYSRPRPDPGLLGASPVKQRAAMFETMEKKPEHITQADGAPNDAHIHVKSEWSVVPLHEYTADAERAYHSLKFGTTIYERPATADVTLVSPPGTQSHRQSTESSRDTQDTFNTAKQSPNSGVASVQEQSIPSRLPEADARKTPRHWLHKWRIFSKSSSAPLHNDEDAVEVIANQDENFPPTRPSTVRTKVEELLRRDEEEQSRRRFELERKSRPMGRRSIMVKQNELGALVPEASAMRLAQLPHVQFPVQEQAELMATPPEHPFKTSSEAKGMDIAVEPSTPVHCSWAEKEVLSVAKPQPQAGSSRCESPIKPTPTTPVRGRREKMRQSLSSRRSPHAREQTFVLSPVPSRSPSRASGRVRVHKVEVEMRDSPEREARERGETVLIVRASGIVEEDEK